MKKYKKHEKLCFKVILNKSSDGFGLIHFILIINLLMILLFALGFIFYVNQNTNKFQQICFQDLVEIQKLIIKSEKQLFLLNPISTALRSKLTTLQLQLAAAIAAKNPPLVMKIASDIQMTIQKQRQLDQTQKTLIKAIEIQVRMKMLSSEKRLTNFYSQISRQWQNYLSSQSTVRLTNQFLLPVQPDLKSGLAPNYELKPDYKTQQRLELFWQHHMLSKQLAQKFINGSQYYSFYCAITPEKENNKWRVKIKLDKSL